MTSGAAAMSRPRAVAAGMAASLTVSDVVPSFTVAEGDAVCELPEVALPFVTAPVLDVDGPEKAVDGPVALKLVEVDP